MIDLIYYVGKLAGINKKYISKTFVLSKEYRQLKSDLAMIAKENYLGKEQLKTDVIVQIIIWTNKDIDACIKIILDSIELAGVIENDKQVKEIQIVKKETKRSEQEKLIVLIGEKK